MEYKLLGRTGVLVSELCFGTMTFGSEADETESKQLFYRCREAGINFFDCSNNYGGGRAETILGNLMKECRNDIVLTTKVSQRIHQDVNGLGSSRRHIMTAVEESLRRLQTDRIDLYFIHHFDPCVAMEETLRALDDLVRQGKVLYLGVSNWAAWQIAKALGIAELRNLARFECIEPMYNLVKRQAEVEILPLALSENLSVIPYSPLGAGLLAGKYTKKAAGATGRITEKEQYAKRYGNPAYYQIAAEFAAYAEKLGVHPATLAIRWVQSHPAITAPIVGARNLAQLEPSLAAVDFTLTPEMLAHIAKISMDPGNATDRLEETMDDKFKLRNR
ncbi:MAG: aldo/keto reductase [Sporomusaceae bacterium]|nr:aldo/keto reductase [Sporomusaceae bacterium]